MKKENQHITSYGPINNLENLLDNIQKEVYNIRQLKQNNYNKGKTKNEKH